MRSPDVGWDGGADFAQLNSVICKKAFAHPVPLKSPRTGGDASQGISPPIGTARPRNSFSREP
jgi:hypothetical protein